MRIISAMLADGQRGMGANWVLSVAEVALPKKAFMRISDVPMVYGCVHSPLGARNDPAISKVILKGTVVGE